MLGLLTVNTFQLLIALCTLLMVVPEKKVWEDNLDQLENLTRNRLASGSLLLCPHPGFATS